MQLPIWFVCAMGERLEQVAVRMEDHPEVQERKDEERAACEVLLGGEEQMRTPAYMDWEDKHHYRLAKERELLYLQGMRDGMQLIAALLTDPLEHVAEEQD